MVRARWSRAWPVTNHWSALTDGLSKYVFNAWDGSEQLFDLVGDPKETVDLAPDAAHRHTLGEWRARMVAQFEDEGRGPKWVRDGELMVRPQGETYGPNFPGPATEVDEGGLW